MPLHVWPQVPTLCLEIILMTKYLEDNPKPYGLISFELCTLLARKNANSPCIPHHTIDFFIYVFVTDAHSRVILVQNYIQKQKSDMLPAVICWFKVNNGNTQAMCTNLFKVNNKDTRTTLLSLEIFHILFWYFHC